MFPPDGVLSVTDLTSLIKDVVEGAFPNVWVAGEISQFTKATSGHLYFNLKDSESQLKAVMYTHVDATFRGMDMNFRIDAPSAATDSNKAVGNDPYFGGKGAPLP